MARPQHDLSELLDALDPDASLVQRHLWLINLIAWIRGGGNSTPQSVARVTLLLDTLQQRPQTRYQLQLWWQALLDTVDATALLADFGFAARSALASELFERMRLKLLPGTPETADASALFSLVLADAFDARWIAALDNSTLTRLADLLQTPVQAADAPEPIDSPVSPWQASVMEAITFCTSQIRAAGFSPELRLRMSAPAREALPFHALDADLHALHTAWLASPNQSSGAREHALYHFQSRLEACRQAAASVYTHLDAHGISVNLVFQLRQLRARVLRIRALLDCLFSDTPQAHTAALVANLVKAGHDRRSLRVLIAANTSILVSKVADRCSETGEHYISRSIEEHRTMLRNAAGGGAVIAVTTWLKFIVLAMGLSAFWGGFFAGMNYAVCFVFIQLLHWTVATKQPAMTAPAMAAKLRDINAPGAIERFVDEVANLVRSQIAAIIGNLALVTPGVLLISGALWLAFGQPMIDAKTAEHVLHELTLLGPTPLFAAFTGVLLFASSIIAGWVENWFVLHRLDSALRYNPSITARLGPARADRWATFMRNNISGLASNISLGLMLGLVPAFAAFFGLGLEVRHVTLSTGMLGAAAATLGPDLLLQGAFWWCVAGIAVIGALNLGVSFYLAFSLALRAHSISGIDRRRIRHSIFKRLRTRPRSFFWPEPEAATALKDESHHG